MSDAPGHALDDRYFENLIGAKARSKQLRRRYWVKHLTARSGLVINAGSGLDTPSRSSEHGRSIVSVDASEWALRRSSGLVVCGDLACLPIRSGAVDGVLALDVLEHLVEPAGALAELHRVLRPRGRLVVSVPNSHGLSARLARRVGDPTRWIAHRDETHRSLLSPDEWLAMAENVGLRILERGSDAPWAAPYTDRFSRIQRVVSLAITFGLSAIRPVLPWHIGENFVFVSEREASATQARDQVQPGA